MGLAREMPQTQGCPIHQTTNSIIGTHGFIDPLYVQASVFRHALTFRLFHLIVGAEGAHMFTSGIAVGGISAKLIGASCIVGPVLQADGWLCNGCLTSDLLVWAASC